MEISPSWTPPANWPCGALPIRDYLAACAATIRTRGYARAGSIAQGLETWRIADLACSQVRRPHQQLAVPVDPPEPLPVVESQDADLAGRIVGWAVSMGSPLAVRNGFLRGFVSVVRQGYVTDMSKGMAAAAVMSFERHHRLRAAA